MAGRYAEASIAGIALEDVTGRKARVDVIDGEGLKSQFTGRSVVALDFTVHTQIAERGLSGVRFGLRLAWMPVALLNQVVEAMETAIGGGESFIVTASDYGGEPLVDDISVSAVPDFSATGGKYFTRAELSSDYVHDVVFRFISTGPAA